MKRPMALPAFLPSSNQGEGWYANKVTNSTRRAMTTEIIEQEDQVKFQYGGDLYPNLARALRAAWADFRADINDEGEPVLSPTDERVRDEFNQALQNVVFVDGIRLNDENRDDLLGFAPEDEGFGFSLLDLTARAAVDEPVFSVRGEDQDSLEMALLVAFGEWNGGHIVEAEALEGSSAVEDLKHWLQGVIQVDGQKLTDWNAETLIGLGDTLYDSLIKVLRSIDFSSAQ